MSDKLTAYRGEMHPSQQDGEAPQQNYGIDPNTGQPLQQGYAPQTGDQGFYQQQDHYQPQGGFQQQNSGYGYQDAGADQYGQAQQGQVPQDHYAQEHYSQTDYSQAQYGQAQYNQAPQDQSAYGYTEQPAQQQYQDPYQNGMTAQYAQMDSGASALPAEYNQNHNAVEEADPYLSAHQNATLPYDPASDSLGQMGAAYDQQGYAQQYQDPQSAYPDQHGFNQQYQDPQFGASNGLAAGQYQETYYQDAGLGADYSSQINNQGLQPLQNNAQPGMMGAGAYAQPGVEAAAMAANQMDASYESDIKSSGRKSFLVGTMILGSVIIGGGVAFAYKYSGDDGSGEAPVITSKDTGIKAQPDDAGGREFANQNKKIFARLGDPGAQREEGIIASSDPEVVESLRGEVKDAGEKVQAAQDNSAALNGGPRRVRTYRIDRNGNQILDASANRVQLSGNDVKDMAGVTVDTGKPARTVKTLKANNAGRPQDEAIQIARAQAKTPPVNNVASNDGNYVVQISARRTQTDALAAFSGLQSKYGSVLGGYRPLIQRADLGSRGIWFRLRVGPMKTREDASRVCSQLKSKGMKNCLVASR